MKKNDKSVNATVCVVKILMIILGVLVITWWKIVDLLFKYRLFDDGNSVFKIVLIVIFYICVPSAALTLFYTYRFLMNIKKGSVFIYENVKYLRLLSYTCLSVVPLSLPLCFFAVSAVPIPFAAGFMSLILRVIKNSFSEGTQIKNENDLTV